MTSESLAASAREASPRDQLSDMLWGLRATQLIHVAAKLGIADLLKNGPRTSMELAEAVGAHPRTLHRILRTLAGLGVFGQEENGSFRLTPLAEPLRSDFPGTLYHSALSVGDDTDWKTWGNLYQSALTGENTFRLTHGVGQFEYLQQHPEQHERFNKSMAASSLAAIVSVIDAYDFSGISRIVDVGGGHGQLITAILKQYPKMQGVLFDLPPVVEEAEALIRDEGLAGRCTLLGGSFLDSVPAGEACVVKSVIMDQSDDDAVTILTKCRKAVGSRGKVIVIEGLLRTAADTVTDIHMLVYPGGQVRTEAEHRSLLDSAGLKLTRVIPTASHAHVLESVPA